MLGGFQFLPRCRRAHCLHEAQNLLESVSWLRGSPAPPALTRPGAVTLASRARCRDIPCGVPREGSAGTGVLWGQLGGCQRL